MSETSPQRTPISACVICYQEADRIEDCVRSLQFCDEILLVDSGSTDGTIEKAEELGATVRTNVPFPGHREQKQLAIEWARHDWVLCLDADERVTPELRQKIESLRAGGFDASGFTMPRRNHYFGRVIRAGLFWPDRKLRLFDRRVGRWGGTNPHDKVVLLDGERVVDLDEAIEHLTYRDFNHQLRTIDSYTRISAEALHRQGRRCSLLDLLLRPPAVMFKSLVLKRGFVDGWRGILIAVMAFYYDWLKYVRLRRLQRT